MTNPELPQRERNRLLKLKSQVTKLQAEMRQLDSRERARERKARARQCIIIGSWLAANEPQTFERVKAALTRPQDLDAFGLADYAANSPASQPPAPPEAA